MTSSLDAQNIESEGFEALQRLYEVALDSAGQSRIVATFLLGLYNSARFPFELTELRALDDGLFEDCMLVLRMDARLTRQEVHQYFEEGGRKFEGLATRWEVPDAVELRELARRASEHPFGR